MAIQPITILVVEDDSAHAAVILRAFEDSHLPWRILHVKTLKEAKSILSHQPPDLMLVDNRLPDGEGFELLPGSIESRALPCVMMTSYGNEAMAVKSMKSGALDYVVKTDAMFADIPRTIERALREWSLIKEYKLAQKLLIQFEHIVSTTTDMIAMIDTNGVYLTANPAYLEKLAKTLVELVGHPFVDVFDNQLLDITTASNAERCLSGETINYQAWFDFPYSKEHFMDVHYYPYIDSEANITGFVINARNMTAHKQTEQLALRQEVQAKRIIETSPDAFIQTDADGRVREWNPKAENLFGWKKEEVLGAALIQTLIPKFMEPLNADVLMGSVGSEVATQLNKAIEVEAIKRDGGTFPVEMTMVVVRDGEDTYFNAFLRDITEKVKSEKALLDSHVSLKESLLGTVTAMSRTVEARDPYTAGHQRRVADIASAIAEEMGLIEDQVEGIRLGAIIHDIGKIQSPAEILSKPTKLTEIEYKLIKAHAATGYDILKDIKFPWPVADIAHQHHERMDGSGYPQGLKGNEICIEARIVAVADVLEAISAHRPYRAALGSQIAIKEITENRGTLYDSIVVDACLIAFENNKFSLD